MILADQTNVGYKFFLILSSLGAIFLSIISVVGYFLEKKPENITNRYLYYGYFIVAIAIILDELTYIIPSCFFDLVDYYPFCMTLGSIQYVAENVIYLFIIGMSMFLYLSISNRYRKCQCRGTKDFGKPVFLFWVITSLGYSVICLIPTIAGKAMDIRNDGRCWFVNDIGPISSYGFQLITHRLFMITAVLLAVIFAFLVGVHVKKFNNNWKDYIEEPAVVNMDNSVVVVTNVMALHKSLLRKFIAFALLAFFLLVVSSGSKLLQESLLSEEDGPIYFGWVDFVYITLFFCVGFLFYKKFTKTAMDRFDDCIMGIIRKRNANKDVFSSCTLIQN